MFPLLNLKNSLTDSLTRNASFITGARVANTAFSFIFWLVAARLYSAEEVGLSAAMVSAFMLLAVSSNLGLGWGIIRFIPSNATDSNRFINLCYTLGISMSLVVTTIFLLGLPLWS